MIDLGYKIEPCGLIAKIIFPDFTKDSKTKTSLVELNSKMAKLSLFKNKKTDKITFDVKKFEYIDKIRCIYVKTQGVCKDYINVLKKEILNDKIKDEDKVCK